MTGATALDVRLFTLDQANATLPLVRRIVADLIDLHPRWRAAVARYELAQTEVTAKGETELARDERLAAGQLAGEIESCLDELSQVGCQFKDFDTGLVDFPAMLDERMVYLCWRSGEDRVEHWHEIDSGVAGRRHIHDGFATEIVP
jgi:hypothetical protein